MILFWKKKNTPEAIIWKTPAYFKMELKSTFQMFPAIAEQ